MKTVQELVYNLNTNCPFITYVHDNDQDLIVKYLANRTYNDWFAEGKVDVDE